MHDEWKDLARAYADETINAEQLERLEGYLQMDTQVRQRYLRELNLIDALEERSLSTGLDKPPKSTFSRWIGLSVVAASIGLIAGLLWFGRESSIGSFVDVQGRVRWTGNDGIVVENLAIERSLSGGTLQLLSADAWAAFRFHDGSVVTVSGESEMVLADRREKQRGKEIHLRHGNFSADVRPQALKTPLVVHTPSAKLHVQKTRFNLAAESTTTILSVNEGSVRMVRSADGDEANVSAGRQVLVSFETADDLVVNRLPEPINSWPIHLDTDVLHGTWKPTASQLASELKQAVAAGTMSESDAIAKYQHSITLSDQGSVWAEPSEIGCFVWLQVGGLGEALVLASDQTRIRVDGRMLTRMDLEFGISTYAIDGGFSGKYARRYTIQELELNESGEFEIEMEITDLKSKVGESAIESRIHDWWCATGRNDAKLEITNVEIFESQGESDG